MTKDEILICEYHKVCKHKKQPLYVVEHDGEEKECYSYCFCYGVYRKHAWGFPGAAYGCNNAPNDSGMIRLVKLVYFT